MTAREHLLLYGRIKGLTRTKTGCFLTKCFLLKTNQVDASSPADDGGNLLDVMVTRSLEAVGLLGVADKAVNTYRYACGDMQISCTSNSDCMFFQCIYGCVIMGRMCPLAVVA